MLKLLILADDFTGALDTGVQFSTRGAKTVVSTETEDAYRAIADDVEVLVLNTESRHLSTEESYRKIKRIMDEAQKRAIPFIYKKVDSALRGNVSAELNAIMDAYPDETISFLPSYPAMKRVLIDGTFYIDQVPVAESIFADDPYEPVTESNLLKRLKTERGIEATLIKDNQLPEEPTGVLVFDSTTDEELQVQGDFLQKHQKLKVTVGCAGFANVLAQQLFPEGKTPKYSLTKPVVVISGSVNPVTQAQVDHIEEQKFPRIALTPQQLIDPGYWQRPEGKEALQQYLALMERSPLVVFETFSQGAPADPAEIPSDYRFRIGESLGRLTEALWQEKQDNTFLFTGGDTLFQSMKTLGITQIMPLAELRPGVVLSAICWQEAQRLVITKSGGFGSATLLEELSKENNEEDLVC